MAVTNSSLLRTYYWISKKARYTHIWGPSLYKWPLTMGKKPASRFTIALNNEKSDNDDGGKIVALVQMCVVSFFFLFERWASRRVTPVYYKRSTNRRERIIMKERKAQHWGNSCDISWFFFGGASWPGPAVDLGNRSLSSSEMIKWI